jgi:eukaryotic-like serine/threonine-protein kinase
MQPPLVPGTVVASRYRILAHLGAGGMAHVYEALHLDLGRSVALKLLPAEAEGPTDGVRFEREARAAARLAHPGCVRVLDYGRFGVRGRYLAMELLEGPTLRAVLAEEGAQPPARAIGVTRAILEALAHSHRGGVLHRDVKPDNVILTERDGARRPVLIDFGLARVRGDAALTASGHCVGSPSYLAPERLLGRAYDARADLYAVGVMLYEMLAGERPFFGSSPQEIARRHIQRPPPPLRCSGPLAAVVARALAKDPRRRFANAEAMLAALADVPAQARREARRREAARLEEEPTALVVELDERRAPLARRMWAWLRFGRWRWSADPLG